MFCRVCDSKPNDDTKCCSDRGCEAGASLCPKNGEQTHNADETGREAEYTPSGANRVEALLNKYFTDIVQHEKNVMLKSISQGRIAQYPKKQIQRFTTDEPLLVFDYRGEGLHAGFIITEKQCIYAMHYDTVRAYDLQSLKCVVRDKKLFSTVMYCHCFHGEASGDIYLNGIRKPDAFINTLNSFLLELNHPFKYAELQKRQERAEKELRIQVRERNVSSVLKQACEPYTHRKASCTVGAPILATNAKGRMAKEKFGIQPSTELYLICDSSILSNCSAGFVLCEQGLIYKFKHKNGTIGWEEMKQRPIALTGRELQIGDRSFRISPQKGKMVVDILTKIKELL